MKKAGLSIIVFLLIITSPLQLFAAEINPVKQLHDKTITDVYSVLTTNIAEAKKAINDKASAITVIIQNYKDKYEAEIAEAVTQYRKDYVNNKTATLENIKNDYINTMEKEKSSIIADIKRQLKQSIDENYQKALEQMLRNIK